MINQSLTSLLKTTTTSATDWTISAGTIQSITLSCEAENYIPIGLVGFQLNNANLTLINAKVNSSTKKLTVVVQNISSASITKTMTFTILQELIR